MRRISASLVLVGALMAGACGGSGGGSDDKTGGQTPTAPTPELRHEALTLGGTIPGHDVGAAVALTVAGVPATVSGRHWQATISGDEPAGTHEVVYAVDGAVVAVYEVTVTRVRGFTR